MAQSFFKKVKRYPIIILILLAAGVTRPSHATSPISVETKVDVTQITLGDVITFSVIVHHDPDMEITPPTVKIEGFDFIDTGVEKTPGEKGQTTHEYRFRLRADETGTHTVNPVLVSFTIPDKNNKDQKIQGQALTPKTTLEVQSVLRQQGEPEDIRDIKPIIPMGKRNPRYWLGLILAVVAALSVWFWKLRKPTVHARRALSPCEQALHELELLKTRQLLEHGRTQEHYFELSEIFRRYIGAIYSFP
ncbi:MAG: hypothetical protein A3K09_07110, partial [Nitrospinae bacterium RIFCSPLOWO2_12_FULL_47_7]